MRQQGASISHGFDAEGQTTFRGHILHAARCSNCRGLHVLNKAVPESSHRSLTIIEGDRKYIHTTDRNSYPSDPTLSTRKMCTFYSAKYDSGVLRIECFQIQVRSDARTPQRKRKNCCCPRCPGGPEKYQTCICIEYRFRGTYYRYRIFKGISSSEISGYKPGLACASGWAVEGCGVEADDHYGPESEVEGRQFLCKSSPHPTHIQISFESRTDWILPECPNIVYVKVSGIAFQTRGDHRYFEVRAGFFKLKGGESHCNKFDSPENVTALTDSVTFLGQQLILQQRNMKVQQPQNKSALPVNVLNISNPKGISIASSVQAPSLTIHPPTVPGIKLQASLQHKISQNPVISRNVTQGVQQIRPFSKSHSPRTVKRSRKSSPPTAGVPT